MSGDITPTEMAPKIVVSSEMTKDRGLNLYSSEFGFSNPQEFIASISQKENATVVDMGSGKGNFSKDMLNTRPSWKVVSLDLEPHGGQNPASAEFSHIPLANSTADAIVASNSLGMYAVSPESIEKSFKEANRILKPNGKIILNVFAPENSDDLSVKYGDLTNPQNQKQLVDTNFTVYKPDRKQNVQGPVLQDLTNAGFKIEGFRKSLMQSKHNVYAVEAVKI